jgi:hypothetical protein
MVIVMTFVPAGVIEKKNKRIKNKVPLNKENWTENDSETKKSQ